MTKRVILFALLGYALALVLPPRDLLARFRG
jgi:hypothetical protein